MSTNDTPAADATRPEAPKLLESVGRLFGPFVTLFGSVAAVSAALIFAGFLSDFGAFQLAGLPRLNFSLTGLAERGADTVIDSLALLAGGVRAFVLALLLLAMLLIWGWHDDPRLRPWYQSRPLHRIIRLVMLVFAVFLAGGLVERAQRSLSDEHHGQAAFEEALSRAYRDGAEFPDPYQRELEIERQTYELRFFQFVNLAAHFDYRWTGQGRDQVNETTGIALRKLPEARAAARHVYGWLTLSALALCFGTVLLAWWRQHIDDLGQTAPPRLSGRQRKLEKLAELMGQGADQPIERVVAPLTLLLAVLSVALLPLAHGLLAREALGAETVMVHLDGGTPEIKETVESTNAKTGNPSKKRESELQDPPDSALPGPAGRLDCGAGNRIHPDDKDGLSPFQRALTDYRVAQRDLVAVRPSESEFSREKRKFLKAIDQLGGAAIQTNCADAAAELWSAMPAAGLRAEHPDIAEVYRQMFRRVQVAYGVRVGTLLGYPRDGQGLTLAETIVPLPLPRGGQSSITELPRESVTETTVIPNIDQRRIQTQHREIQINPDSKSIGDLLFTSSSDALDAALDLLHQKSLHANASGVAVTSIGRLANIANFDRPKASKRAVDLLVKLASQGDVDIWPEKSDNIRGAAVSALHLARSAYAAHRFIDEVEKDPMPEEGCTVPAGGKLPLGCLTTVSTAAGLMFQDIIAEIENFRGTTPPKALTDDRDRLATLLMRMIANDHLRDDVRGAACTALGFAGKFDATRAAKDLYVSFLEKLDPNKTPFSAPVCISRSSVLGVDRAWLRQLLRDIVLGQRFKSLDQQNPTLHSNLRTTSLIALMDLGVSDEVDLAEALFLKLADGESVARIPEMVFNSLMRQVNDEAMAGRLTACALATDLSADRRAHCLSGYDLLEADFDGDDGTAARLHVAIRTDQVPRDEACAALGVFKQRGSKFMARLSENDAVMAACKLGRGQKADEDGGDRQELKELLRQLMEKAKGGIKS